MTEAHDWRTVDNIPRDGTEIDVVVQVSCWSRGKGWSYRQYRQPGIRWEAWVNRPHGGWAGLNAPQEHRTCTDDLGNRDPEAVAEHITELKITHWRPAPALPAVVPQEAVHD